MKLNRLLLIPGVLAVTLACLPVIHAVAQMPSNPTSQMRRGWQDLNLTETQRTQMNQIREQTKAQIEQILTPEQRANLQTSQQNGGKMRGWKNLNLTETQKQQMRQIKESSMQQMQQILTPEQRATLQQKREGMKQRMQQNRQNRQQ